MINYPSSLDNFTNPTGTDLLENSNAALDHDVQHSNANDAIEALQAKVGADSSAVTTSHDYKLSEVTSTDKAVGKTATQTLTNKTLTAPVVNVGSDAAGDMYYRNGSGALTRLPIGTANYSLTSNGTAPEWVSASTVTADEKNALAGTSGTPSSSNKYVTNDDTSATPSGSKVVRYNSGVLNATTVNYQAFTSSGTWTKPSGLTGNELVTVQLWGAGGGGGGLSLGSQPGGGGGGGGAYSEAKFRASDLGATVSVTIGTGGAGGVGGADGSVGGNSSFGSLLIAYGGGGGGEGGAGTNGGGGGGGGITSAGANGDLGVLGAGGGIGGGTTTGQSSNFGGGAGGYLTPFIGGASVYGGGGGGSSAAGTGGISFYGGAGGGGGTPSGAAASGGTAITYGGNGGAGGSNADGSAGIAPGGGGGGAGNNSGAAKNGGAGARGECRVFVNYLAN